MQISVVIPTHNRSNTIQRAIDSVRAQTRKPDEIIIVDDGSTDSTESICRTIAAADDTIRYIRQDNKGAGPARNNGVKSSTGDLIMFLDSDDQWLPDHAKKTIDAFNKGADFVFSRCIMTPEGEQPNSKNGSWPFSKYQRQSVRHILSNFSVKTSSLSVSRSLIQRLGYLFIEENRSCQDYEFIWRAAAMANKIEAIDEELCIIWLTAGGESRRRSNQQLRLDHLHAMTTAAKWLSTHANNGSARILLERAKWEGRELVKHALKEGGIKDTLDSILFCVRYLGVTGASRAIIGGILKLPSTRSNKA